VQDTEDSANGDDYAPEGCKKARTQGSCAAPEIHSATDGVEFVYLAVVLDAFSRRVVGGRWAEPWQRVSSGRIVHGFTRETATPAIDPISSNGANPLSFVAVCVVKQIKSYLESMSYRPPSRCVKRLNRFQILLMPDATEFGPTRF
jgi:hypothetical protein